MGEEEEDLRKCSFSSDGKNRAIKIKVCTSDTFDPCSFSDPFPVLEEIKKSKTQKGKCDIMILNNWDPDLDLVQKMFNITHLFMQGNTSIQKRNLLSMMQRSLARKRTTIDGLVIRKSMPYIKELKYAWIFLNESC